MRMIEFL